MAEDEQGVTFVAAAGVAGGRGELVGHGLVTWRASFSRTHLRSAALHARKAATLDPDASDESDEGVERVACTTAAIFTAVAAIEAAVSEVYVAAVEQQMLAGASVPQRDQDLAAEWGEIKAKPAMDKAKSALHVVRKDAGDLACWKDITDLFKLRNVVTHYTAGPIVGASSTADVFIHAGDDRLRDLEKSLSGNTQLRRGVSADKPYFPFPYLNGSCAMWAVGLSRTFIEGFWALMGHPFPVAQGG